MTSFYADAPLAPRPNRPREVSVLSLMEDPAGRLLFDRRADAPVWALIGGRLEHDETFVEALRREIREETGLEIESYELFGTFSDPSRVAAYADGNVFQLASIAFRCQVRDISSLRPSSESVDLRFFERAELPPEDLVPTHRVVLGRYLGDEPGPFLD